MLYLGTVIRELAYTVQFVLFLRSWLIGSRKFVQWVISLVGVALVLLSF